MAIPTVALAGTLPSSPIRISSPFGCSMDKNALVIRMGGGPRTFPGGVNKWQWKRMQEKKEMLREKAWLTKEKRIYERRKREELMAASPVLEKPWEEQGKKFTLPLVDLDPKVTAMADRFRKNGAVDLWTEDDGPIEEPLSPYIRDENCHEEEYEKPWVENGVEFYGMKDKKSADASNSSGWQDQMFRRKKTRFTEIGSSSWPEIEAKIGLKSNKNHLLEDKNSPRAVAKKFGWREKQK